ncbi:MAG TPA: response regulator [Polyangia bacterium]|nr:response regulator [Polyangia bacterium]
MRAPPNGAEGHASAPRGEPGEPTDVVLIVDDDEAFREVVAELVVEEGLAPVAAANGRQALELLVSGLRPIAILLDMMMPVMDGPAFRKEQLAMESARSIPVAVTSASGLSRQQIAGLFGDVDFLPKPAGGAAVVAFLQRCRSKAVAALTPR